MRIRKKSISHPKVPEISVNELFSQLQSNLSFILVDVRSRSEYNNKSSQELNKGRIEQAISIPFTELVEHFDRYQHLKDKEIITICAGDGVSVIAADIMIEQGFTNVKHVAGGMYQWNIQKLPVIVKDEQKIEIN